MTTGTHTTPIQRYIDDMTFTFTQEADYCSVDVRKQLHGDHGGSRVDFVQFNSEVLSVLPQCWPAQPSTVCQSADSVQGYSSGLDRAFVDISILVAF